MWTTQLKEMAKLLAEAVDQKQIQEILQSAKHLTNFERQALQSAFAGSPSQKVIKDSDSDFWV